MRIGLKVVAAKLGLLGVLTGVTWFAPEGVASAAAPPKASESKATTRGALASGGLAKPTSASLRVPVVGVGPGFFFEDTDRTNELQRAGLFKETEEVEDFESDGRFNLQAWILFPAFFERLSLGGGVAWYNKYTIKQQDEEDEENFFEIGHMVALAGQGEFMIPEVVSKLNVMLGLRAGLQLAFAGGELKADVERLDNAGYSVGSGLPRYGWFVGPHLGFNWPFSDRIRLRTDIGVQFSTLTLWSGIAEDAGITSQEVNYLSTTRTLIILGPEFTL